MHDFDTTMAMMGMTPHADQRTITAAMAADAAADMISLIEAPPATGKTHAMVWHALTLAATKGERVLIAVPTLSVMRQTMGIAQEMIDATLPGVGVACICGRQEYVDDRRTKQWLAGAHPAAVATYESWAEIQGLTGWTRMSLDDAMNAAGFDIDLPPETGILGRRGTAAETSYRKQFDTDCMVVLVTHAMLARDVTTRAGPRSDDDSDATIVAMANERRLFMETADDLILPAWWHLIVDEAHQLAAGFMLALTARLSYRRLIDILTKHADKGIPERTFDNLRRGVASMESSAPETGIGRSIPLSIDDRRHTVLVRCVEACIPERPEVLGASAEDTAYLERFRDVAILAQRHRRRNTSRITWSDVHSKLGLSISPLQFGRQIDYCFRACRSAVLISATLYSNDDETVHDHIMRQLALPDDRVSVHEPIVSDWQTSPVVLHVPTAARARLLIPDKPGWDKEIARMIAAAASASEAGTLVLFTSHQTIEVVRTIAQDPNERVMITGDRGVAAARKAFVAAVRDGRRPIWLATGPAWTGLDLPDDTIDTLVITRLPFGMTNPIMHNHMRKSGFSRELYRDAETDMLKMLRQGMGRLVRSRTSSGPKHLWIGDGRIGTSIAGRRAEVLLERYPNRVSYDGTMPRRDAVDREAGGRIDEEDQQGDNGMRTTGIRQGRKTGTRSKTEEKRITRLSKTKSTIAESAATEAAGTIDPVVVARVLSEMKSDEILRLSIPYGGVDATTQFRMTAFPSVSEFRNDGHEGTAFTMGVIMRITTTNEGAATVQNTTVGTVRGIAADGMVVVTGIGSAHWNGNEPSLVGIDEYDAARSEARGDDFGIMVKPDMLRSVAIGRTGVTMQDMIDLLVSSNHGLGMRDFYMRYSINHASRLRTALMYLRPLAGDMSGVRSDWAGWPEHDAKVLAESLEYTKDQRRKAAEKDRYVTGGRRLEPDDYENETVNPEADTREAVALLKAALLRPGVPGETDLMIKNAIEVLTMKPVRAKRIRKKS